MDHLSETLPHVMKHFNLKSCIFLISIGAGVYTLIRFGMDSTNMFEGLLLTIINLCAEGWMKWAAHSS